MKRVLIVSSDIVGTSMAGVGIRAFEIANALSDRFDVTLAVPNTSDLSPTNFNLVSYSLGETGSLSSLLSLADTVIGQGFVFEMNPELLACDVPTVIDLYVPMLVEFLDLYKEEAEDLTINQYNRCHSLIQAQLKRGDFFICATEQQRDYWLGALTMARRISPVVTDLLEDRDMRSLIDLVPSGLHVNSYKPHSRFLRGIHSAIGENDFLLLWAGGLWDWLDPCIVIRAVAALQKECPRLRLCFFSGNRPTPYSDTPFRSRTGALAQELAKDIDVIDQSVIFLDKWVPYNLRYSYLLEADAGVSAHLAGIEPRLAFRTRLLDYISTSRPVICTKGESLGDEIANNGGGLLVSPGDLDGWIESIRRVYADENWHSSCHLAMKQLEDRYLWRKVTQPLATFCNNPHRKEGEVEAPSFVHSLQNNWREFPPLLG